MHERKLRVCVVGCSMMGAIHAARWNRLPEARVVAVADINPERAEKLAGECGLDRWHLDYREAVVRDDVDVVSVCIPAALHPEVTVLAANHGKHVLSEKPIALTLGHADAMIEAAKRNGVKMGIGFMRRYSPIMDGLRTLIAEGHFGRPLAYHALDARELRPKREMHDAQANGGPVIDMGVHLFDIWNCIFASEPVEVCAQGMILARGRPEVAHIRELAIDTATVAVRYASGDTGTFVTCWALPAGVNPPSGPDHLFGPKAAAEIAWAGANQQIRLAQDTAGFAVAASGDQDMYQVEIASFARCILEDRPPVAGGEEGRAALRIALAAVESIKTHCSISL
jgi:predicted dehydrogenase